MTDKATVRVTLIQAEGLVAKDRNLLGKRTSSDPYVECYSTYGKQGTHQVFGKMIGKTVTQYKTLKPVYNHTYPEIHFAYAINPSIQLRIFDEDKLSDPDAMGTVKIPIDLFQDSSDTTAWYPVPKDSAKNATGRVQVRLQVTVHKLQQYVTLQKQYSTKPPKKIINVNGINKINPKYLEWKKRH